MRKIKDTPRAAVVLVKKDQLAAFRNTTGQSIGIIRKLYFVLAVIVAFGVVYNSARIALSERSRDLATLRVVGFSQGEVAGVLLGELTSCCSVTALPIGLMFGRVLTTWIIKTVSTETSAQCLVVISAHPGQCHHRGAPPPPVPSSPLARMLRKLDLVGVLKARE